MIGQYRSAANDWSTSRRCNKRLEIHRAHLLVICCQPYSTPCDVCTSSATQTQVSSGVRNGLQSSGLGSPKFTFLILKILSYFLIIAIAIVIVIVVVTGIVESV